ncbi:hypothetical protein ZOSMA_99G00860 [Zostera marina]|uniref:Uncharacterized protein n=1 Tax=Zostera marina TaxID=29655 RepID=A0A0K9NJM4_ZOSMR|nr:hypothetical protein ZOSMA_99G00860 [Zostera marina]
MMEYRLWLEKASVHPTFSEVKVLRPLAMEEGRYPKACYPIRTSSSSGGLFNSIELTKQLQTESGIWFMDFLDVALKKGINTDCIHHDCSSHPRNPSRLQFHPRISLRRLLFPTAPKIAVPPIFDWR